MLYMREIPCPKSSSTKPSDVILQSTYQLAGVSPELIRWQGGQVGLLLQWQKRQRRCQSLRCRALHFRMCPASS
eukprot:16497_4